MKKIIKEIIQATWMCSASAFLILIFVCVFTTEISKDDLSLSLLGLLISVLTIIALLED